jgi:hypothetical protein
MTVRKFWKTCVIAAGTMFGHGVCDDALGAEGAASNYFPGGYGSLLVAVAPEPGPVLASLNLFYSAEADRAVLQGRANVGIDVDAYYTLLQGLYVWDAPSIGGRFAIGGYLPFGYAALDSSLTTGLGTVSVSDDRFELGDIGLIPASFYWNSGNFNLNLYELVIAPSGQYGVGNAVNVGRNYWSFDTIAALTWFNPDSGTEVSVIPGLMLNLENPDTSYQTGSELHVEVLVNQFVTESLALGVTGYGYEQLSGDSGSGAILGDFKSSSYGVGLALSWIPAFGAGKVAVSGKLLHDLDASNRMEGDYGAISVSIVF